MDLQVTSTGKIFYEVPPLFAAILVEALPEAFKRVEKQQPTMSDQYANLLTYSVGTSPTGLAVIIRRSGRSVEYISGSRADIVSVYPDCPSTILDQWERVPETGRAARPPMHTRISPVEG